MAYQDGDASLLGSLLSTVDGTELLYGDIHMSGSLYAYAYGKIVANVAEEIILDGTLSAEVVNSINYVNSHASMYGFLRSGLLSGSNMILCNDIYIDMEIQKIQNSTCKIGESMKITRYRGDTYPIVATLGRNGNFNASGITFKMSTRIADGTVYTSTGTVIDEANGIVQFNFPSGSTDIAGEGVYDIQGEDGYVYTYQKGTFVLLDDVTK